MFRLVFMFSVLFVFSISCRKTEDLMTFTEQDEISLGEKLSSAINQNSDYDIVPTESYSVSYGYANSRLTEIVASSTSKSEEFVWSITIMDDARRLAFALPGGYLYITTGMIFYLENEDQFSGLIAHLVAHVDQSHITKTLFLKYAISELKSMTQLEDSDESLIKVVNDLDLLSTNPLKISRAHELAADTLAISYLSSTSQSCQSESLFFNRILTVQPDQQQNFIGAHSLTNERVENIEIAVMERSCDTTIDGESASRYQTFRNGLPK